MLQRLQRRPGLHNTGDELPQSQEEDGKSQPKCVEELRITTIFPELLPGHRRRIENFFIQFQQPLLPMAEVVKIEAASTIPQVSILTERGSCPPSM